MKSIKTINSIKSSLNKDPAPKNLQIIEYKVDYVIVSEGRKSSFTDRFNDKEEAIDFIDDMIEANESDELEVCKITLEKLTKERLEVWERFDEFGGELVETLTREAA